MNNIQFTKEFIWDMTKKQKSITYSIYGTLETKK